MANLFLIILLPSTLMVLSTHQLPLIGIKDSTEDTEFVGVGLRGIAAQSPIEKRKVEKEPKPSSFCEQNSEQYQTYCSNMWTDRPQRLQGLLFTFCPSYENQCLH